ncbi:MAG: NADP-dependent oxidoreductase [Candidatus Nomurabacteria bacterium]|nr:MAG: NADP-dependent oxidoreductase [Candidatus Nomurabacteria bacterium]
MKAAQINDYGDSSSIQINEAEKPTVTDDKVLVEVGAAGLNPFDLAVLAGFAKSMAPLVFPATLGQDFAGTIVEVGANVSNFAIGDRVYGTANAMFGGSGAFAEFTLADVSNIAHTPDELSDVEAASLPTAGISALQAIDTMNVQNGNNVFINGGSGGVGSIAIEIAKSRGAHVATTVSGVNIDYTKSLGADEVIDYKTVLYSDVIHDYDSLLNNVRSNDNDKLLRTLKKGGVAVSLVGPFDEDLAKKLGVATSAQMTHINNESLTKLAQLIDQGVVHATIDRTLSLNQIKDAYDALANESIRGKIVISIR